MKTKQRSMTQGNIWKEIILFSIPLLIGNLFQQLYNTVDSLVVGNYVGENALAAVGASNPLSGLIIGFFMGISTGAGILVSRYFGGKKEKDLNETIHTFIMFSLITGVVLTFVGLFMSPILLRWLGTPTEIFNEASVYLKIYFMGVLGLVIYNAGSGILSAVGDSKNPLIYLIIASIINVVLDLVFVIIFKMGIEGVAYATLIAQATSAILVIRHLLKIDDLYKVELKHLRINLEKLSEIVRLGIPTAIQSTVVSFSNVIVQSYINGFGASAVAGFTAADKFNAIMGLPTNTFSLTITTFTGQNLGAGRKDRVKEGIKATMVMTIVILILLGIPTYLAAPQLISIFSKEVNVINYGVRMLRIMLPFYPILAITFILSGALRGSGSTLVPMIIMVFSFTVLRQIFLFIMMKLHYSIDWIYWSYSVTWFASALLSLLYYRYTDWLSKA